MRRRPHPGFGVEGEKWGDVGKPCGLVRRLGAAGLVQARFTVSGASIRCKWLRSAHSRGDSRRPFHCWPTTRRTGRGCRRVCAAMSTDHGSRWTVLSAVLSTQAHGHRTRWSGAAPEAPECKPVHRLPRLSRRGRQASGPHQPHDALAADALSGAIRRSPVSRSCPRQPDRLLA